MNCTIMNDMGLVLSSVIIVALSFYIIFREVAIVRELKEMILENQEDIERIEKLIKNKDYSDIITLP